MTESELGMIPKGWEIGILNDLINNIKDTIKAGATLENLPYLPIDIIPMKSLSLDDYKSWKEA